MPKTNSLEVSVKVNPENLSFLFYPIPPQQLTKAMNNFKTARSFGLDLVSSYFFKLSMSILASSLSQIFNLSMSQRIVSDDWKTAKAAPVHKSGPTDECQTTGLSHSYQLLFHCLKNLFLNRCIPILTMIAFFIQSSHALDRCTQF